MADPLSIIASTLTLVDATRSVITAASEYLKHAKNAPKELQVLIEDLEDLNGTIKKLDEIAKSRWNSAQNLDEEFKEWQVPLDRLVGYAKRVKSVVERQDFKIGRLHELAFRALWPIAWKDVQKLLAKIDKEKHRLHFATAIEGVGMARRIYMLVEERLPTHKTEHLDKVPLPWQRLGKQEPISHFLDVLGPYLDWGSAIYDFPGLDDPHYRYVEACAEHSCDVFLESPAYLGWKNRKTPGPSLLRLQGTVGSGKSILCGQIVRDLQASSKSDIGVAYFHYASSDYFEPTLLFCIMQLAFQAQCLPESLIKFGPGCRLEESIEAGDDTPRWSRLTALLISILPKFRRTYFVFDDFYRGSKKGGSPMLFLTRILEQDLGNVSIVITSSFYGKEDSPFEPADVSIRLLKVEYRAQDITKYVELKIEKTIRPELEAHYDQIYRIPSLRYFERDDVLILPDDVLTAIRNAIVAASDNLYLAADMFIDSVFTLVQTHPPFEKLDSHLREIRESSEVMMQRDPEIMKQKQIIAQAPNRGEDDTDDIEGFSHMRKRIPVGGGKSNQGADTKIDPGEGSSRT